MISPHDVDQFCCLFSLIAPACVVLTFRRALLTVPIGAIIPWITLWVCGRLLADLDPERRGGFIDNVWLLFGWLPSLLYASCLYGLRRLFLFLRGRYTLAHIA